MKRDTYIAAIVEAYIPNADKAEKIALTKELWGLFDSLYKIYRSREGFDSSCSFMIESCEVIGTKPITNI